MTDHLGNVLATVLDRKTGALPSSGGADRFMERIGDYNKIYADGDAPTFTKGNDAGFEARVAHGEVAGRNIISRINSGEIVLAKNDAGEVIETIKLVTHSMGYAYAIGVSSVLIEAGYKVEVAYNLAPENDNGGGFPAGVNRIAQYGVDPKASFLKQDQIAPQSEEGIPNAERAYIPKGVQKDAVSSHLLANYGWIFGLKPNSQGYVAPSQNNAPTAPLIDKDAKYTPPRNVNAKDNE